MTSKKHPRNTAQKPQKRQNKSGVPVNMSVERKIIQYALGKNDHSAQKHDVFADINLDEAQQKRFEVCHKG